jgi:hypothetical protein
MVLVLLAALGVIDARPHSAIGYNVPDCDAKSQWRNQPFSVANPPRNFNVRQSNLGPKQGSGDMQRSRESSRTLVACGLLSLVEPPYRG